MIGFQPRKLPGPWISGFALDLHTVRSTLVGHDEYGRPEFETEYTEAGKLLYQLKYRSDETAVEPLTEAAESFMHSWDADFEAIVPVPPTKTYRTFQPVLRLAAALGSRLSTPVLRGAIRKVKHTSELKGVSDPEERRRLLEGAFEANAELVRSKRLLLVDDLYRSGTTMSFIAQALAAAGAEAIYAFAFTETRTRS